MEDNHNTSNVFQRLSLLAVGIALLGVYCFRSFALYVDIVDPIGMEECHTGAIAREILRNGFEFPIEQYTPEYYEKSIIVAGLLTVFPVWIMGLSSLSVEMTPFILSFAAFLMLCLLLYRSGFGSGVLFFIVSFFFISAAFFAHTMDSVGSHVIGFLTGAFIICQFHAAYVTKKLKYFYSMMFAVGLGLFLNLASLMFAGLCLLVYLFYKPAQGEKTRFGLSAYIKGMICFFIGATPFFVFLVKTKMMNATYLLGVFSRRNVGISDWNLFFKKTGEYMLIQFDGRLWLAAVYCVFVLFVWIGWWMGWGRRISESKRVLLFIICFFPAPVFAAIVMFSGGGFTTYHIYLLPLFFMAGAAAVSLTIDSVFKIPVHSAIAQLVCSGLLLVGVLSGDQLKNLNFSMGHAIKELTRDEEESFCYWRFGRSFGNYTFYDGDTGAYAAEMLAACGRFDDEQKKSECLWGWSAEATRGGFSLDANAAIALGPDGASLIARSKGKWATSLLKCFEVHEAFVGDCFLGIIERAALKIYSVKKPEEPYLKIPCLPEKPVFSGLVRIHQENLREATGGKPQRCPDSFNMLCIMSDAYCAAAEMRTDFCKAGYQDTNDAELCEFVYEHTLKSEIAKMKLYAFESPPLSPGL